MITPKYHDRMEPVYPCRHMITRHCPAIYDSVCDDRPCARYESEDPNPWIPEIPEYLQTHEFLAIQRFGVPGP